MAQSLDELKASLQALEALGQKQPEAAPQSPSVWGTAALLAPALAIMLGKGVGGKATMDLIRKALPEAAARLEASPMAWLLSGGHNAIEHAPGLAGYVKAKTAPLTPGERQLAGAHPRITEALDQPVGMLHLAHPSPEGPLKSGRFELDPVMVGGHEVSHALGVLNTEPKTIDAWIRGALHSQLLAKPETKDALRSRVELYPDLLNFYGLSSKGQDAGRGVGEVLNELLNRESTMLQVPNAYRPSLETMKRQMIPVTPHVPADNALAAYGNEFLNLLKGSKALPQPLLPPQYNEPLSTLRQLTTGVPPWIKQP